MLSRWEGFEGITTATMDLAEWTMADSSAYKQEWAPRNYSENDTYPNKLQILSQSPAF